MPPSEDVRRDTRLEPGEIVAEILLPRRRGWAPEHLPQGANPCRVGLRARGRGPRAAPGRTHGEGSADRALGCRPVPWRAKAAEKALAGQTLDAGTIARAAAAAVEGAQPLEENGYKVPLLRGLVEERLTALAQAR